MSNSADVHQELAAFVLDRAPSAKLFAHTACRTSEESMEARFRVSGERVTGAKALLIKIDRRDQPVAFAVVVLPGFSKLDSKALKQELKARIPGVQNFRFATPEEMVDKARGMQPGKMPPFGRPFFPEVAFTFIDDTLFSHPRIGFNAADFEQSIIVDSSDYLKIVTHDGIFRCSEIQPMTYLRLVTPTNIADEKAKFFASTTYSPQFAYNWDQGFIEQYKAARPELAKLVDALLAQDTTAIAAQMQGYFDVQYRPADIAMARDLVREVPPESNGTAEELAAVMEAKLRDFGIDYAVEVVDRQGFQCRPDHKAHTLRISKYLHLQFHPVENVADHELVHIIRAVNGQANDIPRSAGYLATDEGLGTLVQDKMLQKPSPSAFQHAVEYLASYVALHAGFREVYQFFLDHGCDAENAWLRSIRQKFGLIDTSRPGGIMKSGMYFYHELLLRELNRDQLTRLFVGKITPADLDQYPAYRGVVPLEKIEGLLAAE